LAAVSKKEPLPLTFETAEPAEDPPTTVYFGEEVAGALAYFGVVPGV
jgi:hypothetical protein